MLGLSKCFLVIINGVLLALVIAMIIYLAVFGTDEAQSIMMDSVNPGLLSNLSIGTYIVLGVTVAVAFCGFVGACLEIKLLLIGYMVALGIVGIVTLILLIILITSMDKVYNGIDKQCRDYMAAYTNETGTTIAVTFINAMQATLAACGCTNYADWINTPWFKDPSSKDVMIQAVDAFYTNQTISNIVEPVMVKAYRYPITCCKVVSDTVTIESLRKGDFTADWQNIDVTGFDECYGKDISNNGTITDIQPTVNTKGISEKARDTIEKYRAFIITVLVFFILAVLLLMFWAYRVCTAD